MDLKIEICHMNIEMCYTYWNINVAKSREIYLAFNNLPFLMSGFLYFL